MAKQPRSVREVFAGMSSSEHDALGEANYGRPALDYIPTIDDRRERTIAQTTSELGMFAGNTRLAPFTGTFTKTRGSGPSAITGTGSGGPAGIPTSNTGTSALVYQGFTTVYDTGGGHTGGRRIKVVLRTGQAITLAAGVEYTVIVYPHAEMNSTGRFLPPPKSTAGCYVYRVNGTDDPAFAGATYTGVANVSPYVNLDLITSPSLAGYTGLNPTGAGGDLVFIYPADASNFEGIGDDEHELCWSATSAFVGPRGIWWPYQGLQRKSALSLGGQLVQGAAPVPCAALQTDQNWYVKPTCQLAPEQMSNGQAWRLMLDGDYAGSGGTRFIEVLVFFGPAEEAGWDPAANNWFDPGPYQAFVLADGATWDEPSLTLTVPGSGIGDLGAAALWVTQGTNAVRKPYLIDSGAGDDVVLYNSLQSGGAASALAGYVGGIRTDDGATAYVSGALGSAVMPFQSPAFAPPGNRLTEIELQIRNVDTGSFQGNCRFFVGGQASSVGGISTLNGAISATNDPVVDRLRKAVISIANARVNPATEHFGITVLYKIGDGSAASELIIPGVHAWYAGQPYDPAIGLGYPLKFTQTVDPYDTVAVVTSYAQDGTHRYRITRARWGYAGSTGG